MTRGKTLEPVPIETGRAGENPVEFQASWARLAGKTSYTFVGCDWDTVEGMWTPADLAKRNLNVVRAGTYDVTISYTLPAATGVAELCIGRLQVPFEPTAGPGVFSRRSAGRVQLNAGVQALEVTATHPRIALDRIWLQRLEA